MGKAPAFQFYPNDWMMDTRMLSLSAKGAWIDLLCAMWYSQTRGMLSLTWIGYARLLGVTVEQAKTAIGELIDMRICECETGKAFHETQNETRKTFHVTECNGNVILINRRMFREYKNNKNSIARVRKYRMKRFCNADVTPPSSSSSSLNTKTIPPNPPLTRGENTTKTQGETASSGPPPREKNFDCEKGFEEFFQKYPKTKWRRVPKLPAERMYFERIKTNEQHNALMAGLLRHKKTDGWKTDGGKYVPSPERFLEECRWQDDGETEEKKSKNAGSLKNAVVERCPECGNEYAFLNEKNLNAFREIGKCGACIERQNHDVRGNRGLENKTENRSGE